MYFRPLAQTGGHRPSEALSLVGGWAWFTHVERLSRDEPSSILPASAMPNSWRERLTQHRPPMARLSFDAPSVMGILNVTPDSFSDGGVHESVDAALAHARNMVREGAHLIDIGGESTRPGAEEIDAATEIGRTQPVIAAIRDAGIETPISIDTRKMVVAKAAQAQMINDVSGFTFDSELAGYAAEVQSPVCIMHSQGDPQTMQNDPRYDNVLLDVYDWLENHIARIEALGIPRARIVADPGIGFGKSFEHNVTLLSRLSLFHGLGTALLIGVSRKGFIGRIGQEPQAHKRGPGSLAVGLHALNQGVQIIRAHDVSEHTQGIALWQACMA